MSYDRDKILDGHEQYSHFLRSHVHLEMQLDAAAHALDLFIAAYEGEPTKELKGELLHCAGAMATLINVLQLEVMEMVFEETEIDPSDFVTEMH